jgi:hypothetical protein
MQSSRFRSAFLMQDFEDKESKPTSTPWGTCRKRE